MLHLWPFIGFMVLSPELDPPSGPSSQLSSRYLPLSTASRNDPGNSFIMGLEEMRMEADRAEWSAKALLNTQEVVLFTQGPWITFDLTMPREL